MHEFLIWEKEVRIIWGMIFLGILGLSACSTETIYAPVTEISTIEPLPKNSAYRVQADDTLYSIAWRYGLDYRSLANINHIARPYHIEKGQVIYLRGSHHVAKKPILPKPVFHPSEHYTPPLPVPEREPTATVSQWHWPARGPVTAGFANLNKGINIGGHIGDPIYTTAPGKVVYSGDGLRAYGNLIIIKHNSVYLSAYAYNDKLLVKEGDWVKSGQKIAEMGTPGSHGAMLHFEIRRGGTPVNPLSYLPRR